MHTHDFFANLQKPSEPIEPRVPAMAPQPARRVTIASYLEHSLDNFRSLDVSVLNVIWKICNNIFLVMQSIFISSTFVRNKNATNLQEAPLVEHENYVFRAMVLLKIIGFAKVTLSTNATAKAVVVVQEGVEKRRHPHR